MAEATRGEVTTLLAQIQAGDGAARDRLVAAVYAELRAIAAGLMRRERAEHTLGPTALVHEALLRLLGQDFLDRAPNRACVFAAAARAMRQVLVDHARRRATARRGGGRQRVPLDAVLDLFERQVPDVLALDEALGELAALHPRQGQVVELRFFGGLSVPAVAEHLGVSVATVEGDFRKASAFLRGRLTQER
jgi:RNA polymerase sigma factor (TIGR02999 family)